MPEIILKNISKKWGGFTAVENLDLVIEDGAFITLLGPSGCGKTTTLRMIAGLETPTSGEIIIDGKTVFSSDKGINISAAKRDVGFLFQNYALWPHMTVYQNIAFGLETLKWKKPDIEKRVKEMLETMQIEQFEKRYPAELSGGQQQRVAIARTLAPRPKVLFMDEPLSNLDAKLRGEMRTELKRLHADTGSTFVYVTHDQLEAMTMATKICLMKEGVLQQYDPPLKVYSYPANRFVADFVGNPTMNFIPAKVRKISETKADLELFGEKFVYTSKEKLEFADGDVTVGIRPEYLPISEEGEIAGQLKGSAYSTLPAGMETTVRIKVAGSLLSSVMFGSLDYRVDSDIYFTIQGSKILLFGTDGTRVASGCVRKVE